jgi:thiol-disulfide isomerase/thioredoxin
MITITNEKSFEEQLSNGKAIVVFSADWCPDCVVIKPLLPEIEEEFQTYKFYYVDRDEHLDLCERFNIFGIPSFIAFNDGEEVGRYVDKDRKTKQQIVNFINNLA